jgi:Leucine-rich repeat (LRR) protein
MGTHSVLPSHNSQNTKRTKQRKNIKRVRGKGQVKYKGRSMRIIPEFSPETMKAKRSWADLMQIPKDHKCQPRLLYPAKLSITIDIP